MAGIRRELPLIDAAAVSVSGKEGHGDACADSDDELTSVSDVRRGQLKKTCSERLG